MEVFSQCCSELNEQAVPDSSGQNSKSGEQTYKLSMQMRQTLSSNLTWVFLALCIGKVSSKEMLRRGVTRDMFLSALKPLQDHIRYLVVSSFALLGRGYDRISEPAPLDRQKIKD